MTKQEFINNNLFKFIGCNCETECSTTKSEDNLYLIGLSYSGRYDDTQAIYDYIVNYNKVDVSGCTDIDNAKAAAKEADFKEKKMLDLIAWCKSKAPEKSYEDIMEWAEKIYNKNYGK